ncbi:hypothetical protein AJ79_01673 [Helicocarpus griseus UAMH5409]|uniref:Fe2OG dioxygenase domain-containing protein n=1 Tax=Helicocarpus griseus UAMH5409 TaxID=1447875 RepID=A0A2B7Y7I2_9EURO|nr:hypothetical protein AJ79_01673 [Helicocarpus griseus UAMH5409]
MGINTKLPNTIEHEGKQVPICDLETVNYSRLLSQEPEEIDKLLRCCQSPGFFYLDLQDIDGRRILEDREKLLEAMRRFFERPIEQKLAASHEQQNHGYEPVGNHAGVSENVKDGYEILYMARDKLRSASPDIPDFLKDDQKLFEAFIGGSNTITKTMLSCLSTAMGLKGTDRFETFHRNEHKSNSTLVMFHYIPKDPNGKCMGHQKHTDIGSLTLLFSDQYGLQVMRPGTEHWEFVAPKAGHGVINVGDSLRFASGHIMESCIHQVVPMNESEHRYSIAFFQRPESEKVYKDSKGRWLTAKQWHDEKYQVFQQKHSEQPISILTGGMT